MATKWYSVMQISEQEKKKRTDLAMMYAEVMALFFELIIAQQMSREQLVRWLDERINVVADNYIRNEDLAYVNNWSKRESEKIVDDTLKRVNDEPIYEVDKTSDGGTTLKEKTFDFEEFGVSIPQTEYWTSELRALLVGIGCASAIANYSDMWQALERGDNRKVWVTEGDEKVRKTHQEVDHTDIPITELFIVGNSYLMFPGDMNYGAEPQEVDNCRCHCSYYKK